MDGECKRTPPTINAPLSRGALAREFLDLIERISGAGAALLSDLARRKALRTTNKVHCLSGLFADASPKAPQATLIEMLLLSVGSAVQFSRKISEIRGRLIRNKYLE